MEFSPLILAHSADLLGTDAWSVFDDPNQLPRAQKAVLGTYHVPELTAGIYPLCLEGEAYGARVQRAGDAGLGLDCVEPLVEEFEQILDLELFDPQSDGRFGGLIGAARDLLVATPGTRVYVPLSGPFTVAAQLMGPEEFLSQFLSDPELGMEALEHLNEGQCALCEEICLAGLGTRIIEVGAAPPVIEEEMFNDVAVPVLHKLTARARSETELPVILQLDGNLLPVVESLVEIGPNILVCPPTTNAEALLQAVERLRRNGNANHHPESVRVDIPGELFQAGQRFKLESWLGEMLPVLALHPQRRVSLGTTALPGGIDPELVQLIAAKVRG